MNPPDESMSLLRYDMPIMVSTDHADLAQVCCPSGSADPQPSTSRRFPSPTKGKAETSGQQKAEEILNNMFPPKKWFKDDKLWVQQVSHTPCRRLDVVDLEEIFAQRLTEQQARKRGICPIRMEIYSQCFDELLRQVTLDCPERGQLLARVREEINMTVAAYQTLFENSIIYGIRKAREAEQCATDQKKNITAMEAEVHDLKTQLSELRTKYEAYEKVENQKQQQMEKPYRAKIEFLKRIQQQIIDQRDEIEKPFPIEEMHFIVSGEEKA
ncbi:axonemal dynein light intermediate polypeptide 1-like [Solea solea]|uniref:axonemal dynein light intermediate polypeptide 1-like n=1 Tax=Solea solea TaxID=90069 RepID=UPI0027295977|nr:axonemal dynein light intermediate polypeptide 1-like [Solea solea]